MPMASADCQNSVTDNPTALARSAIDMSSESAPVTGARTTLYRMLPYVAVVLFALSMLGLVWLLQRQEIDAQRDAVARDMQWAEQTMRLKFQETEDFLAALARDSAAGRLDAVAFQSRTHRHVASNAQLTGVLSIGKDGAIDWRAPVDGASGPVAETLAPASAAAFERARETGRPAYGPAHTNALGEPVFEVLVPVRDGGRFLGAMAGVYSVKRVIHHLVPPWFSERYRLTLSASGGKVLAVNSSLQSADERTTFATALDPPGNGLLLQVTALQPAGALPHALPAVVIIGLSVIVLWSLWLQRSHMLRRVRVEKERDSLFNLSLDILGIIAADGTFQRCNPAFERLLGYPAADMPGRALLDLVHEEDVVGTIERLRVLASGSPVRFENRCRCADGGYKWLVWSINPISEERLYYAVAHDVTGRKATEEALRAETAFRRAMEESVITGLRAIDLTGRIIYVNSAFCRMVGLEAEALVGAEPPFPYWPKEDAAQCMADLALTLAGKAPERGFEMRIMRKDGEQLDVRFYLSPLIDGAGKQTGWMASVTDITEPVRIRAALQAAQARFEAVLDGLDSAVFVADAMSDEILYANRAFMVLHGFDAVGRAARSVAKPQPERRDYRVDPHSLRIDDVPMELFDDELRHPVSGRWYHLREQATRWVDGRVVRMAIATDITDRRNMEEISRQHEERLQRTSRLISMGEMASALAHELNQPLAAISNYAMGCVKRLETGEYRQADLLAAMQKASFQAERAGKIIHRVRNFVRKSEPRRTSVSLAELIDDALGFAQIDARKGTVQIHNEIARDLPPVYADRIMIEQVVLNLVRNGIDAMSDAGEGARELTLSAERQGEIIEVAVSDRGHGIRREDAERLFTPFFTTKPEGMGMGLNICRSIIEFHDGRLWSEPNPGGGTVFRFTLPVEIASERGVRFA